MKIFFPIKDPKEIVSRVTAAMQGRQLGEMVSFTIDGSNLVVTVSKFGTTVLTFSQTPKDNGLELLLTKEKIAFTHRAFVDEVKQKFARVLESSGATVS